MESCWDPQREIRYVIQYVTPSITFKSFWGLLWLKVSNCYVSSEFENPLGQWYWQPTLLSDDFSLACFPSQCFVVSLMCVWSQHWLPFNVEVNVSKNSSISLLTFYVNSSINSNVVLCIRQKRSRIPHLTNKFRIALISSLQKGYAERDQTGHSRVISVNKNRMWQKKWSQITTLFTVDKIKWNLLVTLHSMVWIQKKIQT